MRTEDRSWFITAAIAGAAVCTALMGRFGGLLLVASLAGTIAIAAHEFKWTRTRTVLLLLTAALGSVLGLAAR